MRTIEIKAFTFEELNEDAKQNAIEQIRESYYEYNDFARWAIDDCSLLEPTEKDLQKLFGKSYNFPLIKNNRKVYFDTGRNRHIDISQAMEIQSSTQFLQWLGLDRRLIDKVDYSIGKDTIEFYNQSHLEFTEKQEEKLQNAVSKFEEHCEDILKRIESDIEYRSTDEAIKDDIQANEYEFTEDGKLI